jgi:cytoskeletal protein RodZ
MAKKAAFNEMLSSERRKLGLTIEQAVASTRIRAKFLIAFEEANFEAMPPFGYAQNMIGTYARFLDLDPKPVIDSFKREYEAHDFVDDDIVNQTLSSTRSRHPRRGQASGGHQHRTSRNSRSARSANTEAYLNRGRPRSRSSEASRRNEERRRRQANARHITEARNAGNRERQHSQRGRQGGGSYNAFKSSGPDNSRRNMIIGIALVVLFVLLVIWGISSCVSRHNSARTTTAVPTTGVASTQSPSPTPSVSISPTPTASITSAAGQPFTISFEVASDTTSDVTVVVDGSTAYSGTAAGPFSQSFTVTDQVKMTISSPDNVTVKKDGSEIQPTLSSDGTGTVLISVGG